jgi:hypothetical protein
MYSPTYGSTFSWYNHVKEKGRNGSQSEGFFLPKKFLRGFLGATFSL